MSSRLAAHVSDRIANLPWPDRTQVV